MTDNEVLVVTNNKVIVAEELRDAIEDIQVRKAALKEEEESLRKFITKAMKDAGIESFHTDAYNVSYIKEKNSFEFDSEAFKKADPETYAKYMKPSHKNESIRFTQRNSKKNV